MRSHVSRSLRGTTATVAVLATTAVLAFGCTTDAPAPPATVEPTPSVTAAPTPTATSARADALPSAQYSRYEGELTDLLIV